MTDLLEEIRSQAAREQLPILRDAELPVMTRILRQARPERYLHWLFRPDYGALSERGGDTDDNRTG